jgi:hypothetical protein
LALELFAAVFAKKSELLVGRSGFRLLAPAAIGALDENNRRALQRGCFGGPSDGDLLLDGYIDFQHGLPALDLIAAAQKSLGHSLSVNKRAVGRTQVAQKAARRGNLQEAMMTGKEPVFGQVEMSAFAPADQKGVMLLEGKFAPGVRPS